MIEALIAAGLIDGHALTLPLRNVISNSRTKRVYI